MTRLTKDDYEPDDKKKHGRHKAESVFARSLAWSLLIDSVHANLLNDTANIWGGGQTIVSF